MAICEKYHIEKKQRASSRRIGVSFESQKTGKQRLKIKNKIFCERLFTLVD